MVALTEEVLRQGYGCIVGRLREMDTSRFKLDKLKEMYRREIGSARAYSQIYDLSGLIDVLEKRDFLSEYAVEVLIEIMEVVGCDDQFKAEVSRHIARTCGLVRNYAHRPEWTEYCEMSFQVSDDEILPEEVRRIVSEDIDDSWEDFARRLDIPEGDIIGISDQPVSDVEKCRKALDLFMSKPPKYTKRRELLTAIARRGKLLSRVQLVFTECISRYRM